MASLTPPQVEAIIKRNEAEKGPKVEDLHDKSEYASKKKSNVDQSIMNSRDATYVGRDPDAPPAAFSRDDVKLIRDGKIRIKREEMQALKGLED